MGEVRFHQSDSKSCARTQTNLSRLKHAISNKQDATHSTEFSQGSLYVYTFPRTLLLVEYRVMAVLKPSWRFSSILRAKTTEFYSQAEVITDNEYQKFSPYIFLGCNVAAVNTASLVRLCTEHGGHSWQGCPWTNTLLVNGLKLAGFIPLFSKQHTHSRILLLKNALLYNIQK
jgi:hypothetical protein